MILNPKDGAKRHFRCLHVWIKEGLGARAQTLLTSDFLVHLTLRLIQPVGPPPLVLSILVGGQERKDLYG